MTLVTFLIISVAWLAIGESLCRKDKFLKNEISRYAQSKLKTSVMLQVLVRFAWPIKNLFKTILRNMNVNSGYL